MEANKAKSVFLSSMSHDIRTPMNGIMGMTKIALQHLDDPARLEDCLKKIETSSEYLMRLLNEVLDMSREDNSLTNVQQGTGLGLSIAKAMVTVETAVDGIDAVERFKAKPEGYYELVLMDIQMPRLIGYGAIKA